VAGTQRPAEGPGEDLLQPGLLIVVKHADQFQHERHDLGSIGDGHPAGLCAPHVADLDRADAYAALARQLGI